MVAFFHFAIASSVERHKQKTNASTARLAVVERTLLPVAEHKEREKLHIVDVNRRVYVWEMSALAHQFDWLSHMFSSALSSYYYDLLARRVTIVMNLSSVTRSYGFYFFLPCLLVIDSDT